MTLHKNEQTNVRTTRKVHFRIVSNAVTLEEFATGIHADPDFTSNGTPRFPDEAVWEIGEEGTGESDLNQLIEHVLDRVDALKPDLMKWTTNREVKFVLAIIQYVSPDDRIGPGFGIGPSHLRLLADLGADLDIDQYYEGSLTVSPRG